MGPLLDPVLVKAHETVMKPIDVRSDAVYLQALTCVEHRLPPPQTLKTQGYVLSLGLRYGLLGIASTFYLLQFASSDDEQAVVRLSRQWPRLVEDHVRFVLLPRLPFAADAVLPLAISRCAERPLELALPLLKRLCPLDSCLSESTKRFTFESRFGIRQGWPLLKRRTAAREFRKQAELSTGFALQFFERRLYALDEVSEIALIGE